jgi:DNA polymerase (family X)
MGGKIAGDGKRYPRETVEPAATALALMLSAYCETVAVAGSLRRGKPECGDIDICMVPHGGKLTLEWNQHTAKVLNEFIEEIGGTGKIEPWVKVKKDVYKPRTSWHFGLPLPGNGIIQVDLLLSDREAFGPGLMFQTGSAEMNIRLRQEAIRRGYKLSQYGLYSRDKLLANTETGIFAALGMKYLEPSERE